MKRLLKEFGKSKKQIDPLPTTTDALGSSLAPATLTSTIKISTADPIPTSIAIASLQTIEAAGVTTARGLQGSPPVPALAVNDLTQASGITTALELSDSVSALAINDFTPGAHLEIKSPSPGAIMQANLGSTLSEQNSSASHSGLGPFPNAQNLLITGGTFINTETYNVYNLCADTGKAQTKVPVPQKPNSSPFFTGRKDVLDKLRKIFVHHATSRLISRHSCLLWGMGGIGKTQICLKFIEEMSDSFSYVFWVDASSQETITMSLKGISNIPAAQNSGVDGSVESTLQWISCIQEEWLIVFDNADDPAPDVVTRYIPPGNRGNILITSRNRSMGRVISFENSIEINEMEESDAMALLLKASCLNASPKHLQAAKNIVTELGCIPLAVDHAGAYIETGKCDINKYLKQFSMHHQTLMSDATFKGASNYNKTVYGTWDLSFKEIKRRASGNSTAGNLQAAHAAILILQICAFYHHSNISKDIFKYAAEEARKCVIDEEAAIKLPQAISSLDYTLLALDSDNEWDDFIFGQGISVLLSFSLMKREQFSELMSVHPLVHRWSQEQMSKSEQQRMCKMGSTILSCAIPRRFTSQDYAFRQLIFPHIKANELYGSQIGLTQYYDDKFFKFSVVMQENGDWNHAEQLQVLVMDTRKKLLGVEHPDTLMGMGNLANIYNNQTRWNESEQLNVQVMHMRKKLLGTEHPDTLVSMANLAVAYQYQNRWNEAEQLQISVMDMRKKLLGTEHPETLRNMANLAVTYCHTGRLNEAEQLDIEVMDIRKKMFGSEHPDTLLSMENLANTYCSQGRWNEAEQLQVLVMDTRKKLLGVEHPDTLMSMGNLANIYNNQRRWNESEQLNVQVMHMRKKILGTEHPDTLMSMANLAVAYQCQNRWNEAEQLQISVMDMRKKLLGTEHPETLRNMANLAVTYCNTGRLNEAEQLDIEVMDIRKKMFGSEHPDTLISMENLANAYCSQGRWNEAKELQVLVMDMRKKLFGVEHPDTLMIMADLACTYQYQNRWSEAERLQVLVMDMRKKLLSPENPATLMNMANLVSTYQNQGRWHEAEKLELEIMNIKQNQEEAELYSSN